MVKIPMFNGKYIFIHGGFSSQSFVGFSGGGTLGLFDENPWLENVPWSRLSRFFWDKRDLPPLMTESLFHGYINPYGIGLMSLSPIIWK